MDGICTDPKFISREECDDDGDDRKKTEKTTDESPRYQKNTRHRSARRQSGVHPGGTRPEVNLTCSVSHFSFLVARCSLNLAISESSSPEVSRNLPDNSRYAEAEVEIPRRNERNEKRDRVRPSLLDFFFSGPQGLAASLAGWEGGRQELETLPKGAVGSAAGGPAAACEGL